MKEHICLLCLKEIEEGAPVIKVSHGVIRAGEFVEEKFPGANYVSGLFHQEEFGPLDKQFARMVLVMQKMANPPGS